MKSLFTDLRGKALLLTLATGVVVACLTAALLHRPLIQAGHSNGPMKNMPTLSAKDQEQIRLAAARYLIHDRDKGTEFFYVGILAPHPIGNRERYLAPGTAFIRSLTAPGIVVGPEVKTVTESPAIRDQLKHETLVSIDIGAVQRIGGSDDALIYCKGHGAAPYGAGHIGAWDKYWTLRVHRGWWGEWRVTHFWLRDQPLN